MHSGGRMKIRDFAAACDAAVEVESAIGHAIVDTMRDKCANDDQREVAHILIVASMIIKFELALEPGRISDGPEFGNAVRRCIDQIRSLPRDADGKWNLMNLCVPCDVHPTVQ